MHKTATAAMMTAMRKLVADAADNTTTDLPPATVAPLLARGLARVAEGGGYTATPATVRAVATGAVPKLRMCHGIAWARIHPGQWATYVHTPAYQVFTVTLADDKTHWVLDRDGTLMRRIHIRPAADATDIASIDVRAYLSDPHRRLTP